MNTNKNYIYLLGILALIFLTPSKTTANDSTIFKAMEDEMARGLNELRYKEYDKPFFLQFTVSTNTYSEINASLGSLITSNRRTRNYPGVRLLVGSYQLNDEKFNDKVNKVRNNDGGSPMPIDLNYWGIRRSLWLMANNSYKNASEKYKNKLGLMQQNNMPEDIMTSPDFSKEKPVVQLYDALPEEVSHKQLEELAREVSSVFLSTPDIIETSVKIEYQNNLTYLVNSEGSKTKMPFRFYYIVVKASIISNDNKTLTQELQYNVKSINDLPTTEHMKGDAKQLVNNLKLTAKAGQLDGIYNGPVLFLNNAVSQIMLSKAFQQNSGLIAKPNYLIYDKQKGLFYGKDNYDALKNRKVIDRNVSIYSMPSMASYNNTPLIGHSYPYDGEAVPTPDSMVLVDKGILINQLNSRTPTTSQHTSNGHMRFYIDKTNTWRKVGADVIVVEASETQSIDELVQKQKELALENDDEYAIIIDALNTQANTNPINYYKVDLSTGEKELVRPLDLKLNMSNLKSIEGIGNGMRCSNLLVVNEAAIENRMKMYSRIPEEFKAQIRLSMGTQGHPASFIYPDGILIESIELKGASGEVYTKKKIVPNPMEQSQ